MFEINSMKNIEAAGTAVALLFNMQPWANVKGIQIVFELSQDRFINFTELITKKALQR